MSAWIEGRGSSRAAGRRVLPSGIRKFPWSVGFLALVLQADAPQLCWIALSLCICCDHSNVKLLSLFLIPKLTCCLLQQRYCGSAGISRPCRGAMVHLPREEVQGLRLHLEHSCMPLCGFRASHLMLLVAGAEISDIQTHHSLSEAQA